MMCNIRKICFIIIILFIFGFVTGSKTFAVQLLTNGDFETGTFTGWTVTDRLGGQGAWYIDALGTTTPESSARTTAVNPGGGSFYAVTDQSGPGTHALEQTFVVPTLASTVILSFDMFANNHESTVIDPIGLDDTVESNQHARVDILSSYLCHLIQVQRF